MQGGRNSGSLQEGRSKHLAMPEADAEASLARRGSGMVQLLDLRGCQERGGWGRVGNSERAPSAPASDLGASPFGRRPPPPLSCDLRLNHARPCIAHFLEAPLRISPGTFLDPGAGGHGAGQILLCSHKPEAPAKGVRKCLSFNALRWRFRLVAGLIGLKRQRRAFEKKRGTNSPPAEVLLAPSPSRDGRLQSSVRCRHGRYGPLFSITSGVRLSWS